MSTKKRLITRMALWTGAVFAVALLTAVTGLAVQHSRRLRWEDGHRARRAQAAERSRQYIGELAKKIHTLPVDPTLVGEIESRYFEERANGRLFVWATGTGGDFLFGVPKETFSRLNAVYDREITPRLREGVFFDRQSFLLGHLDDGEDLELRELKGENEKSAELWQRLRRYDDPSSGAFVMSAPLKKGDGVALGSLYLRRVPAEHEWYQSDERLEAISAVGGGVAALAFGFLWVLLPTWVYVDASERGVRRVGLYAFLTVISSLVGLVVYLIARPEESKRLACPGCSREVNGGAFCPHCGRDLSASFCATCRYPLKPDWVFCPACRTEIKSPAIPAPEAPPAA
jgi:hypothetical protein